MNNSSAHALLQALTCHRPGCDCHRSAQKGHGSTHCPVHDDSSPSLSVTEKGGRLLVRCFGGCSLNAIIAAVKDRGLWPGGEGVHIPSDFTATMQPVQPGCTLAQYAEAKKLPLDFLRGLDLSDIVYQGHPAVRIPYLGPDGEEVAVQFRLSLEGSPRFRWRRGDRPALGGLERLQEIRRIGYVTLVEGPSDRHTLVHHGEPCLNLPSANVFRPEWGDYLEGISRINIILEPDSGGKAVLKWLAHSPIRERAHLVHLDGAKDPSALYLAEPEHFPERWRAALEGAIPWAAVAAEQANAAQRDAWEVCAELARSPNILDRLVEELRRCGVAGEERAAKLLFLVFVSRLLERPISAAVKGPSAAGKSYLLGQVSRFLPDSAYFALSGMSERALAYSEEPLAHRVLVIYEAAGVQGEFASYLVRSLLSEGRVRYQTVEKTKDGLRPRLVEREGPTGLLMTTTAVRLQPENETRLLSIPVSDTREQTAAIMLALASEGGASPDLGRWHALQRWLEGAEHRVAIPFARELARSIPPIATRLRRDFGALLGLISAHALLHQTSRRRDGDGRIVATDDDYGAVRELVGDLIAEGIEASVSPTIRETVEAVVQMRQNGTEFVTVSQVAGILNLDKATALRRVRAATERGYLKNLEERRGRPARLILGDPLPQEVEVLPPVERLQGCTVAVKSEGIDYPPPPADDRCFCGAGVYVFTSEGKAFCQEHAPELAEVAESW